MLLVRTRNYLKSVPRYRFLILGTTHPDTLYIRQQGREDPWLFFEAMRIREQKGLGNIGLSYSFNPYTLYVT